MFHVTVFWIEEKGPYHLGYIVCTQRQKVMIIITTMPFKLKGLSGWSFKRLLFSTTVYLYLYMYVCMVKNKFIITSSFSKCYSKLDLISVGNRQCFLFWHIRNRWRVSKPSGKNFEVALMGKKKKKKVLEQFIDYNVVIQNSFLEGLVVMVMHLVIGELLLFFKKRRI